MKCTSNLSTWEGEAGASWVQGCSGLYGNTLFQKYKSKTKESKDIINLGSAVALYNHALYIFNHQVEWKLVKVHFSHSKCVQTFSLLFPKWDIITMICIVSVLYSRHGGGCESVVCKYCVIYTNSLLVWYPGRPGTNTAPISRSLAPTAQGSVSAHTAYFMGLLSITLSLFHHSLSLSFHPRQPHSSLSFLFKQK